MGVALLVALAAVIVVLVAVGASLRAVASVQRAQVVQTIHDRQLDLLLVGELLAKQKLQARMENVVFPLAGGPMDVVADKLYVPEADGELSVWLYDGLAGMPYAILKSDATLRAYLPVRWQALRLDATDPAATESNRGLDGLILPTGLSHFPVPMTNSVSVWSPPTIAAPVVMDANNAVLTIPQPSLVEVISTVSQGRINRNTAPEWLLRAVYQAQERDGIADAIRLRERGQFDEREDDEARQPLRLVATSDRWYALIAVVWQGRQRRWWIELVGNDDGVRIVQRHDAAE